MKIVHVCPYSPTQCFCGVGQTVWELSERQVRAGHDVSIVTSDWDKTKRIKIKNEVVDEVKIYYCYHYLRIGDFSSLWPSVYKKILKLKPSIICCHMSGHAHGWLSMKAAKKLKIPFVINCHCPWESKRSVLGKICNFISYKFFPILKHADAIISITPWEHKFLLAEGVDKDKIHTIPNGMAKEFFEKVVPNKFKEKHNISEDHKIVLFFGRLNYTKNPLMFLDIAESILKKKDDVTFVICGPDEGQLKSVEERINSFPDNIKKNIRLLPPIRDRKDVIEMYQASNVYVMPSLREGLPLTLFESYASGLAVVGSSVNGIPFELEDEVNGFLLKHNDLNGFIDKVNLLLDDEELRNKMAENNRVKAKGFDWDIIERKTMAVYETTTMK